MSTLAAVEWISNSCISLIGTIINTRILYKEIKKRKSAHVVFTTRWLKLWPLIIIILGVAFTFIRFIEYFPPFCYVSIPLQYWFISSQGMAGGFYQLSRLYYCFSKDKVYSNRGYPNWLFIIMYIIGGISMINASIYPWFFDKIYAKCGINHKYQYFTRNPPPREDPNIALWINIAILIYLSWDILTLLLYTFKVFTFRRLKDEQIQIYNRIMLILKRILILTMFYELGALLCFIFAIINDQTNDLNAIWVHLIGIIFQALFILTSVMGNYAAFLMQQHNTDEYEKFLRFLYFGKCYHLCCCCKSIFVHAAESYVLEKQLRTISLGQISPSPTMDINDGMTTPDIQSGNDTENGDEQHDDTMGDTASPSVKLEHSLIKQKSDITITDNTISQHVIVSNQQYMQ